jgi:RNA polymerase sigma-32 factor
LPEADLIAEGNFGVVQALGKFDPDRGVRFSTYASHWIRASLLEYIVQSWSTVGGGRGVLRTRMFFRIRRERALVASYLGSGQGANDAVAARIGVTPSAFADMASRLDARDLSLDTPIAEGSGNWGEALAAPDDQERDISEREVERSLATAIALATHRLDARERCIVEQRLMAHPEDEATLADLGRQLGVSSERARQLEQRTMSKLRSNIAACADPVAKEWLGDLTG